ncbi:MAG: LytTR family transcriptional regulator DNA-binding domain-containing protein [Treponema sp.]|nr:LytTR family transcriptional regulator DNA-binding domain-containing protein [Treponema sp.]
MKITILDKTDPTEEDEIILKCGALDENILDLLNTLKNGKNKLSLYKESSINLVDFQDILYFESVDDRVFAYTESEVFESKQKLYQLEETLPRYFLRASKAVLVNINKIENLSPDFSGRIEASLCNECKVIFSRMYVPVLKKHLGL